MATGMLTWLLGCGGTPPSDEPATLPIADPVLGIAPTPEDPLLVGDDSTAGVLSFEATVVADKTEGSKRLQGIYLLREDGERWVLAYRQRPHLLPFVDQKVAVTGQIEEQEGQALMATHFDLATMRLLDPMSGTDPVGLGPLTVSEGRLEVRTGDEGTKSEGETWTVLVAGSGVYEIYNPSELTEPVGTDVTARFREVERSPVASHRGGQWAWVFKVDPK